MTDAYLDSNVSILFFLLLFFPVVLFLLVLLEVNGLCSSPSPASAVPLPLRHPLTAALQWHAEAGRKSRLQRPDCRRTNEPARLCLHPLIYSLPILGEIFLPTNVQWYQCTTESPPEIA